MASQAIAAKPPAGVSKETMWKKLASSTRKLDKYKESALHFGEVFGLVAIAGGTAVGTAFLFKKFPEAATIPGTEIPTQPVVGGAFVLLGAIKKSKMSYMLVAIGIGMLIPYLFDLGEEMEFGS